MRAKNLLDKLIRPLRQRWRWLRTMRGGKR